ncbi:hypothetical protein SCLCIDRAFT_113112 [Scleroderma citrinum Foug A]|uniref:HAT C-terminal dimerisation domain-containing protein n=1 Tax=Scleroderma citrinum Foug A TaxID=1036808 RepID=A0A0C3AK66_9AGAM|nr:hypothetical protein SCLCIDRAFT_113112 [Scleroderma citrinum Foug A]
MAWGGPDEQAQEIAAGNPNAKNWHDEAFKVVEGTAWDYWQEGRTVAATNDVTSTQLPAPCKSPPGTLHSDFDRHRRHALEQAGRKNNIGWSIELRRYLKDLPTDVSKDTDIITWWSDHASVYPTLSKIVKDVCTVPASSVPCERLFSAGAEIATDRRSCLGAEAFEELQVMKHAWRNSITDLAAANSHQAEEVSIGEYEELYHLDEEWAKLDENIVVLEVVHTSP